MSVSGQTTPKLRLMQSILSRETLCGAIIRRHFRPSPFIKWIWSPATQSPSISALPIPFHHFCSNSTRRPGVNHCFSTSCEKTSADGRFWFLSCMLFFVFHQFLAAATALVLVSYLSNEDTPLLFFSISGHLDEGTVCSYMNWLPYLFDTYYLLVILFTHDTHWLLHPISSYILICRNSPKN